MPKLTKAIRTSSISTIGSIQAESRSNNNTSSTLGESSRSHPEVSSSSMLEMSSQNQPEVSSSSMHEILSRNNPEVSSSSVHEILSRNNPEVASNGSMHEILSRNNPEVASSSMLDKSSRNPAELASSSMPRTSSNPELPDTNADPDDSRPGIFSFSAMHESSRTMQAEELPLSPGANPLNDPIDRTAEIPPAESADSAGAGTSDSTTFLNQFYQAYIFSGPAHLSAETMMRMLDHFRELRGDTETNSNISEDMPRIDSHVNTSNDGTDLKDKDEDLDADVESLSSGIIRPSFSSGKHVKTLPLDSSITWSPRPLVPSYVPSYSVPSVWNIDNCREKLYRYTFLEGIIYPPGYIP